MVHSNVQYDDSQKISAKRFLVFIAPAEQSEVDFTTSGTNKRVGIVSQAATLNKDCEFESSN